MLSLLLPGGSKDSDDVRIALLQRAVELMGSAAELGRALGYGSGAFIGQMLRGERPITEKTVHAMAGVRKLAPLFQVAPAQGVSIHPVAQELSPRPFDTPPICSWENLMQSKELPARFVVAVPDEAIDSKYPAGTEIVFDRSSIPKVGRPVIVEDRAGLRYLRIYGNVRGERWQALATSVGHATLDSEADGLVLLAAAIWIAA